MHTLLGDTVMMLSGEYATLNSHWEDWTLPSWYHPVDPRLTLTSVALWNDLSTQHSNRDDSSSPSIAASPRFPLSHPLTAELYRLQDSAAVIHFTAVGKPWSLPPGLIQRAKPDAHPGLAAQMELWRSIAEMVCPGAI